MVTPHLQWKFHDNWFSGLLVTLLTKKLASQHRAVSPIWPKIESGRPTVTPYIPWKFHANRSSRFLVILLTKKQRYKERKKSIENNTSSPLYRGRGNNVKIYSSAVEDGTHLARNNSAALHRQERCPFLRTYIPFTFAAAGVVVGPIVRLEMGRKRLHDVRPNFGRSLTVRPEKFSKIQGWRIKSPQN